MTVHWLRRIAALLIPVLLVVGLSPTDLPIWPRAMAQAAEPAKIRELPWGESERLAAEVQRLTQTVSGLVAAGEDAGGLYQWHQTLTEHRTALLGMASGVKSEWDANEATMRAAGAPDSALQRHRAVSAQVQERLNRTMNLLAAALAHGSSEEALPAEVGELQKQLEAWNGAAGPVWQEVLPFGPARSNAGAVPVAELGAPSALPIATDPPSGADLAQETAVDEQVLAQVLNESGTSLKQIAGWVYQQVQVQWYLDRQKSPMAVLDERAGNDTDTAGLLVALLRRAEIPARYAQGQVVLASSYWPGLFGLFDQKAVADYLTGSGIPVQQYGDASLVVPHTWVEAWDQASGTWVALDAAWKSHVWPASAPAVEPAFDLHRYLRQGQGQSPLAFAIGTKQGEVARAAPVNLADGMPRMRLTVTGQGASWSTWPVSRAGEFTLSVGGASLSLPVSEAHGQHIFVWYEPATDSDRTLVGLFSERTPSYLVNVRPVIMMDGRVVAEGAVTGIGSVTEARVSWSVGGQSETLTRQWVVGDPQSLIFLARPVRPSKLEEWQKATLRSSMRSVEDLFGLQLSYLQFDFLRETEGSAGRLAEAWRQRVVDGPRLTMASFSVAYESLFGIPLQEADLRIAFDAARVAVRAQPSPGAPEATVLFGVALGAEASYRESQAVTGTYGFESVSTVTSLSSVTSEGDTLIWACRLNGDKELPAVDASDETKKHIAQGFDSNLLVVAPRATNEDEAYVLIDPVTGASGYYLSGGRNGSLSKWLNLKDRNWIVDWQIDLLVKILPDRFDALLPGDKEQQTEELRAIVYGMIDGFAAGVAGEWEGIKGTFLGIWEALGSIPKSVNFLWRLIKDREFREQVALEIAQGLYDLAQTVEELKENWDEYLAETYAQFRPYLAEISGLGVQDPLMNLWVIYYPAGWLWGRIGEFALTLLVGAGIGKAITMLPKAQKLLQSLRLIVTRLPKGLQKVVKVAIDLDLADPNLHVSAVLSRAKHADVSNYLDDTTMALARLDGNGKAVGINEAYKPMLQDLAAALKAKPVEDRVHEVVMRAADELELSYEDTVILRFVRSDVLADASGEHTYIQHVSKYLRLSVEFDDPIVVGEIMRKYLPPSRANAMIRGDRDASIYGFITRKKYLEAAKTPDEIVALTRQDGFNGVTKKGNKYMYWIDQEIDEGDVQNIEIPFSPELGGHENMNESVWPFGGNGFTTTENGQVVPEWRFRVGESHRIKPGSKLMGMDEEGSVFVRAVFDGQEWNDLRPDLQLVE